MRICLIQSRSEKGAISKNVDNHKKLILGAAAFNPDLIVFPELSITGYEPLLAEKLATTKDDPRFEPLQELSDVHSVIIGIGVPISTTNGVTISALFFQPNRERFLYSKQILHEDEEPYFVPGKTQPNLLCGGKKVAFGICYETLQREHFTKAVEDNADIYVASVAKPDRGVNKAYLHFPSVAEEFKMPMLMSNAVGYCDNFLSNGNSAAWNRKGELLAQLSDTNQGLLLYDTEKEEATVLEKV